MDTERHCHTIFKLDIVKAIRAIQQAELQLRALDDFVDCEYYDNGPALNALRECLRDAGHPGY